MLNRLDYDLLIRFYVAVDVDGKRCMGAACIETDVATMGQCASEHLLHRVHATFGSS